MDTEGDSGGVDLSNGRSSNQPGPRNRVIGVIGKSRISADEKTKLRYAARCIVRLGHAVALIPAPGVANAIREGVEIEKGELLELENDVIGHADMTHVFPDARLLERLLTAYPNLHEREDVFVLDPSELDKYTQACSTLLQRRGIPLPT